MSQYAAMVARGSNTPEDSPMRVMVPVFLGVSGFIALGMVFPVLALALLLLILAGVSCVLAVLCVRIIAKFFSENSRPGGILALWRPSFTEGLSVALEVLVKWAPFGIVSMVLFSCNGLLVHWMASVVEHQLRAAREHAHGQVGALSNFEQGVRDHLLSPLLPDSAFQILNYAGSGLHTAQDVIAHALILLGYVLIIESYMGWAFAIWLTVRAVMYFMARQVLAEKSRSGSGGKSMVDAHVEFDMEFDR